MKKKHNFHHILNTSSTLLGLCFVVLTSLQINKYNEASIIDEFTAVAMILFLISSILSYLSMRSNLIALRYEKIADIIFLMGLLFLVVITVLITLNVIK